MSVIDKVILISIDNLRYDCVGYQPDKRELKKHDVLKYLDTPTLDAIASKSLCFTNCISTSTYTTAAHASVFTGLYPPRHGVRAFFHTRLHPDVITIAEVFRRNGYRTICATDIPELFEPLGLTRGFQQLVVRNDQEIWRLLESCREEKVFLFVHFFDVHEPYLFSECPPHEGYNNDYFSLMEDLSRIYDLPAETLGPRALWQSFRQAVNHDISHLFRLYLSGVSKFDRGRFSIFIRTLKDLGIWDRALTVIFSDHGEGRCFYHEPNFFSHAGELYDNVLRVPLFIYAPEIAFRVSDVLVSLVDVFPTVLEMAGVRENIPYSFDGIICHNGGGHDRVYAEVWAAFKGGNLTDDSKGNPRVPAVEIEDNEWLLFQRCIRTKKKKLVITGKQEDFREKATFELPEEEFVRLLYRKVLARFEDAEGFTHHTRALKEGVKNKEELLVEFLQCKEYRSRPRVCLYDLVSDPEEEKPQALGESLLSLMEGYTLLEEILRLEGCAVEGEKIFAENKVGNNVPDDDLSEKEQRSMEVIREAFERFGEACGVAYTGGKDSTVLLHLIRRVFQGKVPFKIINVDTGVEFEEVCRFRDRMREDWGLDLHVFKNKEALRWLKIAQNPEECCYHLKTVPMKKAIEELGFKALFTGVRWDENPARANERYFSERTDPPHVRVHPLLHFTEQDIWSYIRKYKVPYCSLYDQGYRGLDCKPCTRPATEGGHERAGRAQDKERIMQRLRELGYF